MTTEAKRTDRAFVLGREALSTDVERNVLDGAVTAPAAPGVVQLTGPKVVDCLQGMLTNDVEGRGPNGFVFGAVLTPKGMIVCDLWVARSGDEALLFTSATGKAALLEQITKYVPPRLAHSGDCTDEMQVLRIVGPRGVEAARRAGVPVPSEGQTVTGEVAGLAVAAARPSLDRPFAVQLWTEGDAGPLSAALADADVPIVTPAALDFARILAGWPALGAEIDAKTLPQEVMFDELDGVSYSKGCYTGQETVARLHFRGHANRGLVGLTWDEAPTFGDEDAVTSGQRPVGRVTSAAWVHLIERWVGLAVVKRTVEFGQVVTAAGAPARVAGLPFDILG